MAKWVKGQSGNPKGRPLRGRSVAELARAIAGERVAWTDDEETVVCSRLERLVRVLFTMACDGDLRAVRTLLEYMEGRPAVQIVAAGLIQEVGQPLSADAMARVLAEALARVDAWRLASGAERLIEGQGRAPGDAEPLALEAGRMRQNG